MWRPRGELPEALAVAALSTGLAVAALLLVNPQSLQGVLPGREPSFAERAARAELQSLARAQERYFAANGRYALDLTSLPWRSGYNLYVRVREADHVGFRATATSRGTDPAACTVTVTRRDADSSAIPLTRITCLQEDRP